MHGGSSVVFHRPLVLCTVSFLLSSLAKGESLGVQVCEAGGPRSFWSSWQSLRFGVLVAEVVEQQMCKEKVGFELMVCVLISYPRNFQAAAVWVWGDQSTKLPAEPVLWFLR